MLEKASNFTNEEGTLSVEQSAQCMTDLPGGERVKKDDARIDACGAVDELNSFIGLLRSEVSVELQEELQGIQRCLFQVGAQLVGGKTCHPSLIADALTVLQAKVEEMKRRGVRFTGFVLPGGCKPAALAHVCRAVCRRAERAAVTLNIYDVVPYLNRLSTYFFFLAKELNEIYEQDEIKL